MLGLNAVLPGWSVYRPLVGLADHMENGRVIGRVITLHTNFEERRYFHKEIPTLPIDSSLQEDWIGKFKPTRLCCVHPAPHLFSLVYIFNKLIGRTE